MKPQWLAPVGALLVLTACLYGTTLPDLSRNIDGPRCEPVGYLLTGGEPVPYRPQPGDLLLWDEFIPLHHFCYKVCGSGPPTHCSIVIAHEDGSPAILDLHGQTVVGAKVVVLQVGPRMCSFTGMILVRRLRQPLCSAGSCALTRFARAQEGKDFAIGRVLLQGTPLNARYGLRRCLFGRTPLDRHRWFCSELVVSAACVAGILDPHVHLANATYPRDLAFDETMDLSCMYEPAVLWCARPDGPGDICQGSATTRR